jgi:hypothetical protein
MFSSTAYEALYTYLGLHLHSISIELITSQQFFIAILFLIFGISFIILSFRFSSKYLPGVFVSKRPVPLSFFVKLIFGLFLGISLLKVGGNIDVKNHNRKSWHGNGYLNKHLPEIYENYKVSFIFKIIAKTGEEIAHFSNVLVDKIFQSSNSQIQAPDFFYKAIIMAGAATIDDPNFRSKIQLYTDACFGQVLPQIISNHQEDLKSQFFNDNYDVDDLLRKIPLKREGRSMNCLTIKQEIVSELRGMAREKNKALFQKDAIHISMEKKGNVINNGFDAISYWYNEDAHLNQWASSALSNYYLDKTKGPFGIHKGSMIPNSFAVKLFQFIKTSFWTKALHISGNEKISGAAMAGERALKFSEMLKRAPQVQGIAKMILIFIFPWMIFLIVAGRWKVLIYWGAMYTSVLMWTPIWTFFYHIMTSLAASSDMMAQFGKLSDGISLYGSQLITSKLYSFYAVYSWVQILCGPLPTTMLGFFLSPLLRDTEQDSAPELTTIVKNTATAAPGMGGGVNNVKQ